jgi:uncharacterized delta-60 repeat protein
VTAAAGDLDPTFGSSGKVTTDFSGNNNVAEAMAIQPNGKIIAVGSAGQYPLVDFALARYNGDGSLDSTFGSGGKVTTDFFGLPDGANAVALQLDGKIVAAGIAQVPGGFVFGLARYNSDGSLDSTFGSGGKVTTPFSTGDAEIFDIAIQSDNKIVAAGVTFRPMADFALARYNSNGSLDSGFGVGGLVVGNFFTNDIAFAIALQSDAKIVVAGVTNLSSVPQNFTLARYNTDGGLDTTFGPGGKVVTDFFNTFDAAFDVVIQADGKIVAAGYATMNTSDLDFALARYNADGSLDPGFGSGGKVITSIGSARDVAYGIALQPDGKIVAAGEGGTTSEDFAAARYNGNGSLDPSFGSMGKVTTDFSGDADKAFDVALQSDGKIVTAGLSHSSNTGDDFALVRYGTSFDLCLQDDSNPNSVLQFNSTTGDYQVCCGGSVFTGKGVVTRRGSSFTLEDNTNGRRVLAKIDESAHKGSASIQTSSGGPLCSIRDTNTTNNTCACH